MRMSDDPLKPAPTQEPPPPSSIGHTDARERAIARLGPELSPSTIETIRRMHVSGEPGVEGWMGIARQVETISRYTATMPHASARATIKEGK
jgi:hypothetical protein